jgi:hypothetical protein
VADRDYLAEMGGRIEAATKGSGWVAAIVAAKLHAQLLEKDPDLLDGWLHAMAVQALRQEIGLRARVERTTARRRAGARAFQAAAEDAEESGDATSLLGLFRVVHTVDESNTRKRAADMTGEEHLFVAENTYQRSANESLMLAAFHRAVAAKVQGKRTDQVFTEQQYESLYLSIARKAA